MLWCKRKTSKKIRKSRFDHLLNVANQLPLSGLPDLLRAIARPTQSDFILGVAEEGTNARSGLDERWFFFKDIYKLLYVHEMHKIEMNNHDYPLSLATDIILPWPWNLNSYINTLSIIGTEKGKPWKQDNNHRVTVWLPWKICFVETGNHSITSGILAGEGTIIPEHVYDMSYLFSMVRTDGVYWYIDDKKNELVRSYRHAAFFEIGRFLNKL